MNHTLQTNPSMLSVYMNLFTKNLLSSPGKRQMKELSGELFDVKANPLKLVGYHQVCQIPNSRYLPVLYPQILGAPLAGKLLSSPEFPLSPMGIIHTGSQIIQYRPIHFTEALRISASLQNFAENEKGTSFDLITHAFSNGELTWTGRTAMISRKRKISSNQNKPPFQIDHAVHSENLLRVPKNSGRRYAMVSGDFNPIHLATPLAWLFGFRQSIAHGYYVLARCIALSQKNLGLRPLEVSAQFKKPVNLGSSQLLKIGKSEKVRKFSLLSMDGKSGHVVGHISDMD